MRKRYFLVIALFSALAYMLALGIVAFRMYTVSASLEKTAEREFILLVEKAEAAGALGFMDQAFRDAIRQTVTSSGTLAAVLVGGPSGTEYAVQRDTGFLVPSADGPRFASRFDIADKTLHAPLHLDGVRNATVSAVRLRINPAIIFSSLRYAFFITLITVGIVTIALIAMVTRNHVKPTETANEDSQTEIPSMPGEIFETTEETHTNPTGDVDFDIPDIAEDLEGIAQISLEESDITDIPNSLTSVPHKEIPDEPVGLYSPVSGLGWNRYLEERLEAELRRSASFEQDLVLLLSTMQYPEKPTIEELRESADSVIAFFTFRDLTFDWHDNGFALILPNMDLEHGLRMSDEYIKKTCGRSGEKGNRVKIRIGLSARAGRLVEAERLIMEAERALKHAQEDEKSPIVAFKPDPERYRNYISSNT